jgi:hypothetical protein
MPISQEDLESERLFLHALVEQVRSVTDRTAVEEVAIRTGLEFQIFGIQPDADDPWDAEESFGIDFGD